MSNQQKSALRKIKRRGFCARWLIDGRTRRSLLRRGLIRECGFYSLEMTVPDA